MTKTDDLLDRLYAEGQAHDASASDRSRMMRNITPSTGKFLDILVSDFAPKRILEIGTSNGYSTIWLARAAERVGATVDTVDCNADKHHAARQNIREAGLEKIVTLHTVDANEFLLSCASSTFDLVFLDSDRTRYIDWASNLFEVADLGTLVVDNAISHAQELAKFCRFVRDHADLDSVVLPIGNGQLVVRRLAES